MATILEPESESSLNSSVGSQTASARLRENFSACRLKFKWLGTSKSLSADQKSQAAEAFNADSASISAGKRLIDVKHDAWKSLTSIKSQATKYWKENSLPYPETGLRLIRQNRIEDFNSTFEDFREQLEAGVRMFDDQFAEIKEAARARLGSLFDASDYPSSIEDEFQIQWDFPSVDPPDYLRRLNPEVYAEQSRRVSQRFDEAVELAESAFVEELDRLVNHLASRLAGDDDGKPKIFRDSAVTNMIEFFTRFRELNIRSNDQLDSLVQRCESLMQGVQPQSLRDNDTLRQSLSTNLSTVQSRLDQLVVDRPRRNIIRPNRSADQSGGQ
jgi:hypothetical protein